MSRHLRGTFDLPAHLRVELRLRCESRATRPPRSNFPAIVTVAVCGMALKFHGSMAGIEAFRDRTHSAAPEQSTNACVIQSFASKPASR